MFEGAEALPGSQLWERKPRDTRAQQPPETTPSSLKALVFPPGLGVVVGRPEAFLSTHFSTAVARRERQTSENFPWRRK